MWCAPRQIYTYFSLHNDKHDGFFPGESRGLLRHRRFSIVQMKKICFLLNLILSAAASSFVSAASVMPMALSELIANADTIVVARCTSVHSYWHDNKILTDNHLEIEHVIKGDSTGQHVVTTLGGTAVHPRLKAPVNMAVPGGASFVVQEEVLIFTQKNSQGINQIVGFTQGKFTIETDDSGKKLIPVAQKKITNKDDADSLDQLFSPFTTFDVHYIMIKTKKIELSEMISKITSAMAE